MVVVEEARAESWSAVSGHIAERFDRLDALPESSPGLLGAPRNEGVELRTGDHVAVRGVVAMLGPRENDLAAETERPHAVDAVAACDVVE